MSKPSPQKPEQEQPKKTFTEMEVAGMLFLDRQRSFISEALNLGRQAGMRQEIYNEGIEIGKVLMVINGPLRIQQPTAPVKPEEEPPEENPDSEE